MVRFCHFRYFLAVFGKYLCKCQICPLSMKNIKQFQDFVLMNKNFAFGDVKNRSYFLK